MYKILKTRIQQGKKTIPFPAPLSALPDRFRGFPKVDFSKCPEGCSECSRVCPTDAIFRSKSDHDQNQEFLSLDLGKCLFCMECQQACPQSSIEWTRDYRLAVREKKDFVLNDHTFRLAQKLHKDVLRIFGRSLKLRQVCAGGCNGCEVDINVLSTPVFDLGRFGIQIVASPRHADGLLVTGPVTENMREALLKTYEAIPEPKIVIAVGACAISGGPFRDLPDVHNGVEPILPVDLFIPGCPPHPLTILDGMLRLIGRIEDKE